MKPNTRSAVTVLSILVLFLFSRTGRASHADTLTGEISGHVLDLQGGFGLSQARVTLTNVERGWTRQQTSGEDGGFAFVQLEPGNYLVMAEMENYLSRTTTDVFVRLNQPKVIIPPFQLRRSTPKITQTITAVTEQVKTLAIDLTVPGPTAFAMTSLFDHEQTSMVSLRDGTLRWNFDSRALSRLPLRNGRTFDQLSFFAPGVARVPAGSSEGPGVGIGVGLPGQFSVNGLRGRSNNFTVDGSDNNDEDVGVRRQGFVALVPQSIETIEDFQIMTAGFPAEFGRNSSSMVNAVSHAGTRVLHGSVYGFFNNGPLNATRLFDRQFIDQVNIASLSGGTFNDADDVHKIYGGLVGGPISSQLFYFLSAERQQERGIALHHFVVPTTGERGLRIQDGFVPIEHLGEFFNDQFIPFYDLAGRGVFSLYPLPNNSGGPFGDHTYSQAKEQSGSGTVSSLKLNWYKSQQLSISGRYNFTNDKSLVPFTGDAINSAIATRTRTQNLSLFLNATRPSMSHAVRLSYGRTRLAFPPGEGSPLLFGSSPTAAPIPPGLSGSLPQTFGTMINTKYGPFGPFGATGPLGQLEIAPFSGIGVDVFNFPQGRVDNTFQLADVITKTASRHTLKFGLEARRSQLNSFMDRNSRPLLIFGYGEISPVCQLDPFCIFATTDGRLRGTDLAALGAHSGLLQSISTEPEPDTTIGLRLLQGDLFFQDDWKMRPNFTVNAGVRYELQRIPREVNSRIERTFGLTPGDFSRLQPTGSSINQQIIRNANDAFDRALVALQSVLGSRSKIYFPDHNNVAPRLGFAWDPSGSGRTVLRGSYDVAFDANLGAFTSQSRNVFPTFVPVNLDLNFNPRPPSGLYVNSANFFDFGPANAPLIRPGTLNTFNLDGMLATGIGALFVQGLPSPTGNIGSNGLAFTLPEQRLKTGYAQHVAVSLEHQFGSDLLLSAGYVGTRGSHLPRLSTPNGGLISTPLLVSSAVEPLVIRDRPPFALSGTGKRPVPSLGAFTLLENSASSSYHSLQISAERRFQGGYQLRSSWTWSHAIDDVSDLFDGRAFFALPQDASSRSLDRASSNFDTRHRFAGYFLWEIPDPFDVVWSRGWRIGMTGEFQSGQPYTVNTALDRNGDGNLTDRPGIGRNTYRADHIGNVDASVSRTLFAKESSFVELRLELFNLFNETSLGIPVRILESPGFGRSFDTQTSPRSARISLKLDF